MTTHYIPGLEKIPAAESSISYIDGEKGILEYRGIRVEDLATSCTFDEVALLLLDGHLPTRSELDAYVAEERAARTLTDDEVRLIRTFPSDGHPMAALETCVSAMGMTTKGNTADAAARRELAIAYIGKFPSLIAAFHRVRSGLDIVAPDPSLGRAADFLRMLSGKEPGPMAASVLNTALILHADHTMNASTFAARVVASTESPPSAAIAAAVGSLSGPLHGGANERVLRTLEEIGSPENVAPWLEKKLANKEKIMGMGHRVYRTKDPRATVLQNLAGRLVAETGTSPLYDTAMELERLATEKLASRGIYPNVDFFSGIVYNRLDIATDLFTPVFALARIAGWMAHLLEQSHGNRLFRPSQIYTGGHDAPFVRIADR